ncbi:FAD-binding and (Fe-S)-binding domain-containing protein [Corynebacterium lubricantis]|uniref:FAD-binding and (Fe-S)-binding domain-containing protein n=1 Tax=Corynebacterium lubricantis TaxID=541095 RepID=UPI00039AFB65|nr:FAD-binding and (Fe-S)-binding domain-containing protein [Corynebacterium lubricantis]
MITDAQSTSILTKLRRDMTTRTAYSSDASIFRRIPTAVLEPTTTEDIRAGIHLARENGWSIVGRGGGSSVAGNAIGDGLIIDTTRHFNSILAIDPEARTATVEPGVICDDLREAASKFGLTYGPDPSTHSRCTIGGMVANNACGSHSVAYGTAAENLISVTLMLADGREVRITEDGADDPEIDAALHKLYADNTALIQEELGRFPRQVSGYGLHYLAFDMAKAIAGSEGTIGIITELTVRLVEKPAHTALAVLSFEDVFAAAAAAPLLRVDGVTTIEGMGGDLLDALRSKQGQARAGSNLPGQPDAGGWLYCETEGATLEEAIARAQSLTTTVSNTGSVVVHDPAEMRELWKIREASAGTVTRLPDGGEAWPNWEDSAVPPENLADYLRDLYALMDKYDYRGIPFGHFGEGCVHVRISFDFSTTDGIASFKAFMEEAARLVSSYGGSLSGEHGDGRARSSLLREMYSPAMRDLFEQFKLTFDPDRIFNPGVLVWADAVTDGLRMDPAQRQFEITPVHAFSHDKGSFTNAVNRCVGVSACRSMDDSMCPSFQVTKDEVHSTRGRARVLSDLFRGETVTGDDVVDALDLCLSCKACASECPVNVDMATYKSEFLNDHYKGKLRPRAHYLMGWLPLLSHVAHKFPLVPRLVDLAMHTPGLSKVIAWAGGLDTSRPLINFAPQSLQKWARSRPSAANARETVVLWPDSFNSKLATGPAQAAVEALEALGFEVLIPNGFVCCGLTWHSTGQLGMTKQVLEHTAKVMKPYLDRGLTVVGIEPSCTVMLQSEVVELSDNPDLRRLAELTKSFAHVVTPRFAALVEAGELAPVSGSVLTQVHCHEQSLGTPEDSSELLSLLGMSEEQIQTGCCGLAGNWGYEAGHGEISRELGERELFPRAREHDGIIAADGFSCRTQVEQGTGKQAVHIAEILRDALQK